jgi:hypothetical protein
LTNKVKELSARPIHRFSDRSSEYLHCTGGVRAAKIDNESWVFEPIRCQGIAASVGTFSWEVLLQTIQRINATPIAFHSSSFSNGVYYSDWTPILSRRRNDTRGPSDMWRSICSNYSHERTEEIFGRNEILSSDAIGAILDSSAKSDEEFMAQAISLSLRSMDISVEQISDFYNEQLTNLIAAGNFADVGHSTSLDQVLYSHVHSFFLHLGCARDYLGGYIASKIGLNRDRIDDMARLVSELRDNSFGVTPVLDLIRNKNYLERKTATTDKWMTTGWLKSASDLRKQLVHKRPYGSMFAERMGKIVELESSTGIYRYFRPIQVSGTNSQDIFDLIVFHYQKCNELFMEAAEVSGENTQMITITDDDVVDVDLQLDS